MKIKPRFPILLPALLLGACAYQTSRSSVVVVTNTQGVVENCQKLGEIDGASGYGAIVPLDKNREMTLSRLKIRGAEMGGTHVFSDIADIKWTGGKTTGTVYKCNPG